MFLFDHVDAARISDIDRMCTWTRVPAGDSFVHHGDITKDVFFLASGSARVLVYSSAGKLMPLRQLAPGDFFGEMSAIDGEPRSASVEAVTPCTVARMTSKSFQGLLDSDPALNRKLLAHFVTQIRKLTGRVYELGTFDLLRRIAAEFLRLAAKTGAGTNVDSVVIPIPVKAQLAHQLGATRESVSRDVKRLIVFGALTPVGEHSYRCDLDKLREVVERGIERKIVKDAS